MPKISAVIITLNEAENIGRCLASVKDVADEVLVLDSQSADNTVQIAQSLGAKVMDTDWKGYAATKNFGHQQAEHNFILSIDADEALSSELIKNLKELKDKLQPEQAYRFKRLNNYCGTWIKRGIFYPDDKIRLFHRKHVQWNERDMVHESLVMKESVKIVDVPGNLLHYTYASIEDHKKRAAKYAALAARQLKQNASWKLRLKMLGSPAFRFFKGYIIKGGFLDGYSGYKLAAINAEEVYMKYAQALHQKKKGQ